MTNIKRLFSYIGKTYVNGLAMEYDEAAYDPKILGRNLLKKDFTQIVN